MKHCDHLYKHKEFMCKTCNVRSNGVKVLLEHCKKEDLKSQIEKCNTFFMSGNGLRKYILKYHKL